MKTAKEKLKQFIDKFKSKDKSFRIQLILYAGIVLMVVLLIVGVIRQSTSYRTFVVESSIEKTDTVSVGYQVIGNGLIRYSRDGASFYKKLDTPIWNQTFEMASARVVSCGDYMAIGDIGSNQIRIFNQTGQVGSVRTLYPIVDVEVAEQGVVAAVLSEGNQNYINLYDSQGEELVTIKSVVSTKGYPVDITLSNDGTKVAVNYLNIKDGKIGTNTVFYHFGSAGQNEIDHIMGSFEYDSVFPKIRFLDNNTIVAYGEDQFIIYSMKTIPEVVQQISFDSEIKSIFSSDKYLGFVFKNPDPADETTGADYKKYHMAIYTTSGRIYMEKDFDFEYQTITCSNREIIMYNDTDCIMYEFNGKQKFSYTFEEPILSLLPKSAANEYIFITSSSIEEVHLK